MPARQSGRVFVLGATATIGRATERALVRRGYKVVCFIRPRAGVGGTRAGDENARLFAGTTLRFGAVPSTGTETLFDFYPALANRVAAPERGDHAGF